jgi:uncharacterized protein (TIGR00369 family)
MKIDFIPKNPDFVKTIKKKLEKQFFMHHLQIDLQKIEAGYIEIDFTQQEFHLQQHGFLHGGVIATLHDVAAGFAAYSLAAADEAVVTADLRVSYLLPGTSAVYKVKGWVLKPGNMLYFCESEVWSIEDEKQTLISKSSSTMAAVKPVK